VAAAAHAECCLHLVLPGCRSINVSVRPLVARINQARKDKERLTFIPGAPDACDVLTATRLACVGYVATTHNVPGTAALPMLALYQRYAAVGVGGLELYTRMLKEHLRADAQRYAAAGICDPSMEGGKTLPQDMITFSNLGDGLA